MPWAELTSRNLFVQCPECSRSAELNLDSKRHECMCGWASGVQDDYRVGFRQLDEDADEAVDCDKIMANTIGPHLVMEYVDDSEDENARMGYSC